jgi:hypothetical protein
VHGGVRVREEVALGIENGARTLARRAGVEIDERMPVHLLGEDREVLLQRGGIERVGRRGGGLGGRGRHPLGYAPCVRRARGMTWHPLTETGGANAGLPP